MMTERLAQQERGRRGRRREMTTPPPTIAQRPFTRLKRPYPSIALISDDQVEHIHQASLKLLSETGLDVLHEGARDVMKKAGADVREGETRVRFDPDLVVETIATVPSEFTLHARNAQHNVTMGRRHMMCDELMNDDATKNATKGLFKLTLHQTTEFRTACSDTKTK